MSGYSTCALGTCPRSTEAIKCKPGKMGVGQPCSPALRKMNSCPERYSLDKTVPEHCGKNLYVGLPATCLVTAVLFLFMTALIGLIPFCFSG